MADGLTTEEYARWSRIAGYQELTQILLWRWDPIGVQVGFPITAEEYGDCATHLLARLRQGMSATEVAEYLRATARSQMEIDGGDADSLRELGEYVIAWHERSQRFWADQGAGRGASAPLPGRRH